MRCPSQDELSQFGRGLLDGVRFDTIALHLEECPDCEARLGELDSGSPLKTPVAASVAKELSWAESAGAKHLTEHLLKGENRPSDEDAPESIGRIKLIRHIASGSFGRVFLGWDEELDRKVAVKLPRVGTHLDEETKTRIRQEARLAARLNHQGIVPIYDIGTIDDDIYIVSAYVDGTDLKEWRTTERPSIRESVDIIARICEIVQYAHEQNLVHRDIKPGNIMIDRAGNPHLVDFGLSRTYQTPRDHASDGQAGTPAYMPPENLDYLLPPLDPRGDVYSIGVVLYELLTSSRPLEMTPENWKETLKTVEPPPPRTKNRSIPHRLERICLKAIDKAPHKRYASAKELAAALRRYLAGADRPKLRDRIPQFATNTVRYLVPSVIVIFGMFAYAFSNRNSDGWISTREGRFKTAAEEAGHVEPSAVSVTIRTEPPGAKVAVVPLNEFGGSPSENEIIRPAGTTPLQFDVPPGEYVVEALLPGHGFHQVFRSLEAPADGSLILASWPTIVIPQNLNQSPEGMVLIDGGKFEFGLRDRLGARAHMKPEIRNVEPFWIAAHESTYGDYVRASGDLSPEMKKHVSLKEKANQPLGYLSFPEAIAFAEKSGLRLLTVTEWEFVATNGGTTDFPWGNKFPDVNTWEDLTPRDRTLGTDPVFGMYSGSGEWSLARHPAISNIVPNAWFNAHSPVDLRPIQGISRRIAIDGLPLSEIRSRTTPEMATLGSRFEYWSPSDAKFEKLGARLGRDVAPRYLSAD